ncbi:DUF371 domain-containing protein [Haloarchaeobius litoreus]|uniref:DUF371 domain-containing protein n=1 Tax=Haloarchaeobius litoreus TaxID=755306 RepID=A0ABD6DEQ1_9EURY|nr:DUF371 domain-containing protein [Haloarchaeobius litoreus]
MEEVIHARGHENVTAEHASTFEVTTDDYLTPAGDCILAVDADRAPADFADGFVAACREPGATITCTVEADGHTDTAVGVGHPDLEFESERSMVGRTSDYVDDRTVMLASSISAEGFDRELVAALADGADVTVTLAVE